MFYDRKDELDYLSTQRENSRKRSLFLVITGRRRVGKTALVREFLRKEKGVYIFIEVKDENLIFLDAERAFEPILGVRPRISSWEGLFDIVRKNRLILVLDEFQNLLQVNKSVFTKIQGIWDGMEGEGGVLMIAVGSYTGMMKKIFTDAKEPLFGRAENIIPLRPFNFLQTSEFLENLGITSIRRKIEVYSVLGGVPKYLLQAQRANDILWDLFYSPMASLRDEGRNLLVMEFGKEHRGYFSVLEAVSRGKGTQKEIADYTGMPRDTVGKYIFDLTNRYELLRKSEPVPALKKNMGRYRIGDNFYSFWFRFVYSRGSLVEINPEKAMEAAEKELPDHIGRIFEDIVRELIISKFDFDNIGSWWSRKGDEIDIVALNEGKKEILFGEVKWRNRETGCDAIADIVRKKELVRWHNSERKEIMLIVSKSGFTRKCLEQMDSEGIMHWDLRDIEGMIEGKNV